MVPAHHRARITSFSTRWSIQVSFQNTAWLVESESRTKTAIIGFIQKSHYLALMIEKRVYVKDLFTHDSLHRSELKTLDGGNPKTQNHHQSVVNSCSLICYVPDQFIVQSTKSLYLAPRILKERTQWEGCGVEDYLKNTVQRIMLLAKKDELELLQNYTVNSNLELTRTKVDSSWISFTHLL